MNQFHNAGHETLARRALDRNRLLEGEDPETPQVEDAVHWSAVYGELIDFKQTLLGQMRKSLAKLPDDAANEIRTVDMAIIRKQLERYESCRAFWDRRRQNLAGERPAASL